MKDYHRYFGGCNPHFQAKIAQWHNRSLSFAGKMQLIHSVIGGIINFWTLAFPLTSETVKEINSILARFLWGSKDQHRPMYKVKWEICCLSKEDGGLGLCDVEMSGKVAAFKNVWELLTKKDNIWTRWIKGGVMRNQSFWQVQQREGDAWYWRNLLQYRGEFQNHIRTVIGDGKNTSIWFDRWLEGEPLYRVYGGCPWHVADLSEGARVSVLINEGRWSAGSNERQREIVQAAEHIPIKSNVGDKLVYGDHDDEEWVTKKVRRMFRRPGVIVGADKLFWFAKHIPRFSFVTWTVAMNRLATADRLSNWGVNVNDECLLCRESPESRDHLFFECRFSSAIWKEGVKRTCTVLTTSKWEEILEVMKQNANQNRFRWLLMRLFWTTSVYRIWGERNGRKHGGKTETVDQVFNRISLDIRHRCMSLGKLGDVDTHRQICDNWGIPLSVL